MEEVLRTLTASPLLGSPSRYPLSRQGFIAPCVVSQSTKHHVLQLLVCLLASQPEDDGLRLETVLLTYQSIVPSIVPDAEQAAFMCLLHESILCLTQCSFTQGFSDPQQETHFTL